MGYFMSGPFFLNYVRIIVRELVFCPLEIWPLIPWMTLKRIMPFISILINTIIELILIHMIIRLMNQMKINFFNFFKIKIFFKISNKEFHETGLVLRTSIQRFYYCTIVHC